MAENQNTTVENNFLKDFLSKILSNIVLVIVIIALSVGCGVGFSYLKTPTYTAKVNINYTAELNSNSNPVDNISIMKDMMQSVVDLSITEIVLEEANYLYDKYQLQYQGKNKVDEFILSVRAGESSFVSDFDINNPNLVATKYYSLDKVSSKSLGQSTTGSGPKYIFTLSLSDMTKEDAAQKVRILALAGSRVAYEFFDGYVTILDELVKDSSGVSVSSDVSVKKNVLLAFIIGVALSIVLVYLKGLLNNTATDKDEIEKITGASVIAFIEDQEDK
jgi:capsular polysaccharide biosynthesis protein